MELLVHFSKNIDNKFLFLFEIPCSKYGYLKLLFKILFLDE